MRVGSSADRTLGYEPRDRGFKSCPARMGLWLNGLEHQVPNLGNVGSNPSSPVYGKPVVKKAGKLFMNQDHFPSGSACCQLVTAFNAWSFLHMKPSPIQPGSEDMMQFVELVGCQYGSAIFPQRAWRCLRITVQEGPQQPEWIYNRLAEGRPVELSTFHPKRGYHSALIIKITRRATIRVVNWGKEEAVQTVRWSKLRIPRYANIARAFSLLE